MDVTNVADEGHDIDVYDISEDSDSSEKAQMVTVTSAVGGQGQRLLLTYIPPAAVVEVEEKVEADSVGGGVGADGSSGEGNVACVPKASTKDGGVVYDYVSVYASAVALKAQKGLWDWERCWPQVQTS